MSQGFVVYQGGRIVARFMGLKAMQDVKARTEERKRRWSELEDLARHNQPGEFFRKYAEYLEWDNIISPSRTALHKMAVEASRRLTCSLNT